MSNIKSMADFSGSAHHWDLKGMLQGTIDELMPDMKRGLVVILAEDADGNFRTDLVNAGLDNAEVVLMLEIAKQKVINSMYIAGDKK